MSALYVEMQRIVGDDGGSVIPVFMAYRHAVTPNVVLPEQIANNWELDGHKNGERWWFIGLVISTRDSFDALNNGSIGSV